MQKLQNSLFVRVAASIRAIRELPRAEIKRYLLTYSQPLLIAIVTYIVASRFATIGVDAHHDGAMFKPALDLAEGKMLFKDTFFQYGALTALLQALALKMFGHYLLVIKLQTAFFYALTSYFLWLIWKRFIPQWLATVCGFVYIFMAPYLFVMNFFAHSPNYGWWLLPWASVYSLFFQTLSLYLLVLFIEKRVWLYLMAAGAAVALTMWSKQPVGAFLFCAISFFIVCLAIYEKFTWKEFFLTVVPFISGVAVVNALFLVWLIANNAFYDMWRQSIALAFGWVKKESSHYLSVSQFISVFFPQSDQFPRPIYPTSNAYAWLTLPIACVILFFLTIINYLRNKQLDTKQLSVFAAVLVCLASWAQYYPIQCERHVYWAAAPMFGMFAYLVWETLKNTNSVVRAVLTLLAISLLFKPDITRRVRDGNIKLHSEYVALSHPEVLIGMKVPAHDAVFFQTIAADIDDYFKSHPDGGLINTSKDALFAAFVEKLSNFHLLQAYWGREVVASYGLDKLYPDYFAKLDKYARARWPIIISHTDPVIYDNYTVRTVGRDMYVTAPGDPGSLWSITAFQSIARGPEPINPVRDYLLEIDYGKKKMSAIRSISVVAADFNGVVKGIWQPVEQTANSVTMKYTATSSSASLKPMGNSLMVPPSGVIMVRLTGHDFPHYSTTMRITTTIVMVDNMRFQQPVSFLPLYMARPEEFLEMSLQRYLAGDFRGSIQAAEDALRLSPNSALAHNNICAAWNSLREWDKAMNACELALALDPGFTLARNNLAWAKSNIKTKR